LAIEKGTHIKSYEKGGAIPKPSFFLFDSFGYVFVILLCAFVRRRRLCNNVDWKLVSSYVLTSLV
jgi:hypothetical protein